MLGPSDEVVEAVEVLRFRTVDGSDDHIPGHHGFFHPTCFTTGFGRWRRVGRGEFASLLDETNPGWREQLGG